MARRGENIRKRKDGRWEARFISGYKEDGKAEYKSIYRKSYAEAKDAKNKMVAEKLTHDACKEKRPLIQTTFGALLTDWLHFIRRDVKESTYSRYTAIIEKHIRPELGEILLSDLNNEDIDCFTVKKLEEGNLKKSGGLSPKTVGGFLSIIRLALDYGIERGYDCSGHIVIHHPRQNMPKIQILTCEEQQKLEQILLEENSTISFGILLSLYLGLRIGEICALRWEDFDMKNGLVHISRSIQRIPNMNFETDSEIKNKTKIVIDHPKTNCSIRNIPIPAALFPVVKEYQKKEEFYVLTGNNSYLEPKGYYRKYKRIIKKCGLDHFNYHALRHTFATRCVENNFDIKSLSEILGHANVSTTLQRYVHPSVNLKRQHMDRLGTIAVYGQNSGPTDSETQDSGEERADCHKV